MTSEDKWLRARSALGWGTAWEDLRVLSAFAKIVVSRLVKQSEAVVEMSMG